MSETLEQSLQSIFCQIDPSYEVIVIDDGSTDNSLEILYNLQDVYPTLRVIPLVRDSRRKLGETRNVSIRAARGEFVLLHIDADDIWGPFIPAFIQVYHEISRRLGLNNFFLSGRQIQMSPRHLLLEYPYRNIYYGEDRVLWNDLMVAGKIHFLNHTTFRTRIPLSTPAKRLLKMFSSIYSSMFTSISLSPTPLLTLFELYRGILYNSNFSPTSKVYQFFILPITFIHGVFLCRHPFLNQAKWPPSSSLYIDLLALESKTYDQFGSFPLSSTERSIFFPSNS